MALIVASFLQVAGRPIQGIIVTRSRRRTITLLLLGKERLHQ